jgi:cell wall assembly regulator SMI1
MLAEALRSLAGLRLEDANGKPHVLELLPPATDAELRALEAELPCPVPEDVRAALRVAKGLANGPLESFSLVDLAGFGLDEVFPCPYSVAHDGFGNYWVLDLLPDSPAWGPVFYACHDPPVIAYQAPTLEDFLLAAVAMWQAGPRSIVDVVHEEVVHRIWREHSGAMTAAEAASSPDPVVRDFAANLPPGGFVADLRSAGVGDGFAWGRFGPRTELRRAGPSRIWGMVPPDRKRGFFQRLFER